MWQLYCKNKDTFYYQFGYKMALIWQLNYTLHIIIIYNVILVVLFFKTISWENKNSYAQFSWLCIILMEAANQVAAYIIFDHSSQSDGSIYFGRPSFTYTICRSKDLEWDLFCFNETFFKTNTTPNSHQSPHSSFISQTHQISRFCSLFIFAIWNQVLFGYKFLHKTIIADIHYIKFD